MAMFVQHNLTAMNSNRMLGLTTRVQAKTTEKLSSGYKINRAADDAAGLSISEKMRKQIRGLTQASLNASDGISAVQTAEGALTEVHDMLQRMNELAVKAANGTLSEVDRAAVQAEVDALKTEIDRVAETTKFNESYLLKGGEGTKERVIEAKDAGLKGVLELGDYSSKFTAEAFEVGDQLKIGAKTYNIAADTVNNTKFMAATVANATPVSNGTAATDILKIVGADGTEIKTLQGSVANDTAFNGGATLAVAAGSIIEDRDNTASKYYLVTGTATLTGGRAGAADNVAGNFIEINKDMQLKLNDGRTLAFDTADLVWYDIADVNKDAVDMTKTDLSNMELFDGATGDSLGYMSFAFSGGKLVQSGTTTGGVAAASAEPYTVDQSQAAEMVDSLSIGDEINVILNDGTTYFVTLAANTIAGDGSGENDNVRADMSKEDVKALLDNAVFIESNKNMTFTQNGTKEPAEEGKAVTVAAENYVALTAKRKDNTYITKDEAYEKMAEELQIASQIGSDEDKSASVNIGKDAEGNYDGTFTIVHGKTMITDDLDFNLHVGSDADLTNKINVRLSTMGCKNLGINGLDVSKEQIATYAVDCIEGALNVVSAQRSALGAAQNRLDHTIANLDNVVENTTAAEAQIRDTDMASEMVKYSNSQILAQAGQAMLAQANQANQGILSILG